MNTVCSLCGGGCGGYFTVFEKKISKNEEILKTPFINVLILR